ncbi:putative peptidase C1-like protein L477 [Ceratocystis lukuohia]|uniref:Peptidase C1-like protein L477 n=1 Tax=Ceratocystis lukuohia TaxID=2019550 RepID=A0ABR4MGT6_9PEZI
MLFHILADATKENTKLGAKAINVAHRTHNGVLNATGLGGFIPSPVQNLTDNLYAINESLVRGAGRQAASFLQQLDGPGNQRRLRGANPDDSDEDEADEDLAESCLENKGGVVPVEHHDLRWCDPIPDNYDPRDHEFELTSINVKPSVDLRPFCPDIYDQKRMASCIANAVAAAYEYGINKQKLGAFSPSRLFIWYNARAKSDNPQHIYMNTGCRMRDAIASLNCKKNGVCAEEDWPYVVGEYDEKTKVFKKFAKPRMKPSPEAMKKAHFHTATKYLFFKPGKDLCLRLKGCLDKEYPFVMQMKTFGSLNDYMTPDHEIRMPTGKELKKTGGHGVMVVGYNDNEKVFIVRNSWGEKWGDNGHFYMPYAYLKHCSDFWTLRVVSSRS